LELLSPDRSHQPLGCHPPSHELKSLNGHLAHNFETVDNNPGWRSALPQALDLSEEGGDGWFIGHLLSVSLVLGTRGKITKNICQSPRQVG